MRALRSINKYLWKYKWLLLSGTLFVGLANAFQVIAPRYIGEMIDIVDRNSDAIIGGNDAELANDVYHSVLICGLFSLL